MKTYRFTLQEAEYQEFIKAFYTKNSWAFRFRWWVLAIGFIPLLLNFNRTNWSEISFSSIFSGQSNEFLPVLLLLFFAIWIFAMQRRIKGSIAPADRAVILSERELGFEETSFFYKDANAESIYQWQAFQKVGQTPQLFLLYITNNSAVLVPKRIFETEKELFDFEVFLKRKIQNLDNPTVLDA